jgi:HNH endonuclease
VSDCILWTKSLGSTGYGQIGRNGKMYKAHRWVWEQAFGSIPDGMFVDHICHNEAALRGDCQAGKCIHRQCVNLEHLRLVTNSENVLAGCHSVDVKATCNKGHSYRDPRNVMTRKNGWRECAECNRERARAVYARRKLVA